MSTNDNIERPFKADFRANLEVWDQKACDHVLVGQIVASGPTTFFIPDQWADKEVIRTAFPLSCPTKIVEMKSLRELGDVLPLAGSNTQKIVASLVAGFGAKDPIMQLRALLKAGVVEGSGLRITETTNKQPNQRDKVAARKLGPENESTKAINQKRGEFLSHFVDLLGYLKKDLDLSFLADNKEAVDFFAFKSMGGSESVVNTFNADGKPVVIKTQLSNRDCQLVKEALANRMMKKAGLNVPVTKLIEVEGSQGNKLRMLEMDNFALMDNWDVETRRLSFASLLDKQAGEIHNMTYDEMANGIELLEQQLPHEFQNTERMNENKRQIFNWALTNSLVNNVDNHGRNIEILLGPNGEPRVAPFFDVNFCSQPVNMSTVIDGNPPIHTIDLSNEEAVIALWDQLGIEGDSSEALALRDNLVEATLSLPELIEELDLSNKEKMDVYKSIRVNSPTIFYEVMKADDLHMDKSLNVEKTESYSPGGMG
jgi:hypothetical protein